jgi:hypothetical protein
VFRRLILIQRRSDLYQRGALPDEGQVPHCQEGVNPVLSEIFEMDDRVAAFLLPGGCVAQILSGIHLVNPA